MFVLSMSASVNEDNLMSTIRKCLFYLFLLQLHSRCGRYVIWMERKLDIQFL
jgi:hypothetical protein